MKEYEADYEYEEATSFPFDGAALLKSLKVSDYERIVTTFCDTANRIQAFHLVPIHLIGFIQTVATAHTVAIVNTGGDPTNLDQELTEQQHDIAREVFAHLLKQMDQLAGGAHRHIMSTGATALKELLQNDFNAKRIGAVSVGVEAILAAIITSGYGALETMAGDLWVVAVNRHPQLADNWIDRNEKVQFSGKDVRGYGYDMRRSMGTMLTRTKRVQFKSFNDIKDAYEHAFLRDAEPMFARQSEIWLAGKVRHLIAHRSGIVDHKFHEEMRDIPEYKDVPVDTRIPLNGPLAARHFEACLRQGEAIIRTVDGWSSVSPTS